MGKPHWFYISWMAALQLFPGPRYLITCARAHKTCLTYFAWAIEISYPIMTNNSEFQIRQKVPLDISNFLKCVWLFVLLTSVFEFPRDNSFAGLLDFKLFIFPFEHTSFRSKYCSLPALCFFVAGSSDLGCHCCFASFNFRSQWTPGQALRISDCICAKTSLLVSCESIRCQWMLFEDCIFTWLPEWVPDAVHHWPLRHAPVTNLLV